MRKVKVSRQTSVKNKRKMQAPRNQKGMVWAARRRLSFLRMRSRWRRLSRTDRRSLQTWQQQRWRLRELRKGPKKTMRAKVGGRWIVYTVIVNRRWRHLHICQYEREPVLKTEDLIDLIVVIWIIVISFQSRAQGAWLGRWRMHSSRFSMQRKAHRSWTRRAPVSWLTRTS